MLQQPGVYPMMNAVRALRLFASYYEDPRDGGELIELLGLAGVATTPFKRLSGGEQQRLALALALLGRPEVALPRRAHVRRGPGRVATRYDG